MQLLINAMFVMFVIKKCNVYCLHTLPVYWRPHVHVYSANIVPGTPSVYVNRSCVLTVHEIYTHVPECQQNLSRRVQINHVFILLLPRVMAMATCKHKTRPYKILAPQR